MSSTTVHLSPPSAAALLERMAAADRRRTVPLHGRTGACRSLFGPVDHDELSRETHSRLREISERDRQRWNFDFEAHSPLAGMYEWVESPADDTPAFYSSYSRDSTAAAVVVVVVAGAGVSGPSAGSDGPRESAAAAVEDVPPAGCCCEDRLTPSRPLHPAAPLPTPTPHPTPTTAPTTAPTCPAEVNQENRMRGPLNSGVQTRSGRQQQQQQQQQLSASCVRASRKRTGAPDSTNTHITGTVHGLP